MKLHVLFTWHAELKCLIRSEAGFILRKPGFYPTTVHGKLVEKVASGQGFLRVFPSSPVSTGPSMFDIHLNFNTALSIRTSGRNLETCKQRNDIENNTKQ
jgi:hypothetical protein